MNITQRNRQTRLVTGAVLLIAIVCLAVLGRLLQGEISRKTVPPQGRKAVAKLDNRVRTVERKFKREVLWEPIAADEVLFNQDSIRTDQDSEAKICFDDGTVLELAENSLVILDRNENKIGIEFLKGSVFAQGGGSKQVVEIKTQNGNVKVGGDSSAGRQSALALTTGKSGLEVTVTEGTAQVQTAQGSAALSTNERGTVAQGGIQRKKISVLSKLPVPNARLITRDQQLPVDFAWSGAEAASAKLEIASDPEFEEIVISRLGTGSQTVKLAEGTYYWRVAVAGQSGQQSETSETRILRIVRHRPVVLESPSLGFTLSFLHERPPVRLSWRGAEGGSGAVEQVQVSASPGFKDLVSPSGLSRTPASSRGGESRMEARFDQLESGDFYWRVVSRYNSVGSDGKQSVEFASEVRRFSIKQLDRLETPEMIEPRPNAAIGIPASGPGNSPGNSNDQAGKVKQRFTWNPVPEAVGYRIRVSTRPDMGEPFVTQFVRAPSWEGEVSKLGNLYWDVQAVAGKAPAPEDSLPSSARPFMISRAGGFKLLSPAIGSVQTYLEKKPELNFSWEAHSGTGQYEVQIAADNQFSRVLVSENVPAKNGLNPSLKVQDPPEGERFWRVRAFDSSKRLLALSETGRYRLGEEPLLAAPSKVAPEPQARIAAETPPTVVFKWQPVEKAATYIIAARRQGANGKYEEAWTERVAQPELSKTMDEGVYLWDVRAIDSVRRMGAKGMARLLVVRKPDRLPAPAIVSPALAEKIEDSKVRNTEFKWEKVPGAESYVVSLFKIEKDGAKGKIWEQEVRENQYVAPDPLPSGNYLWQVAAVKPKPGEIASSEFSLKWVGLLEQPKVKVRMESDRVPAKAILKNTKSKPKGGP